jgi:dihydropteroate synthase
MPKPLALASRFLSTGLPAFVMGIVNATPDSFWGQSRVSNAEDAVRAALKMEEDGADIIDIGGESTRPGAGYADEQEEIRRVAPAVEAIRKRSNIAVSIDTRKRAVMEAAFEAGADMLNDVSALEDAPALADFAARTKIPVILMHKRGSPAVMQDNTAYTDARGEVDSYLRSRAEFALSRGIAEDKIIVDPGIGFGKNLDANIALIKNCGALCGGKFPVLMALSRKACIGEMTGGNARTSAEERLAGTLAAHTLAVLYGASIVRVHDVRETVDCLKTLKWLT